MGMDISIDDSVDNLGIDGCLIEDRISFLEKNYPSYL